MAAGRFSSRWLGPLIETTSQRDGRAPSAHRGYVRIFKGFHRFPQAREAVEIVAAFGVRPVCPVDELNASRHVGDDSPALLPPPAPERVEGFFDFLKTRIATASEYARRPRLRAVPDAVSRRPAFGGGLAAGSPGRPLRSRPVRQAARAQRRQHTAGRHQADRPQHDPAPVRPVSRPAQDGGWRSIRPAARS